MDQAFERGTRVRVFQEGEWYLGIIADPNNITEERFFGEVPVRMIMEVLLDSGELKTVQRDERIVQQVMSAEAWSREIFPQFCRDIAEGRLDAASLARSDFVSNSSQLYDHFEFCLDDGMAPTFAGALRQTTNVKELRLQSRVINRLSVQGLEVIAQEIAACSSLRRLVLHSFNNTSANQTRIDILCSHLGASRSVNALHFADCLQPSIDAFQELCNSPITYFSVMEGDFLNHDPLQNPIKTDLYRFKALKSVSLTACSSTVVVSCFLGLVKHPSIKDIDIDYFESTSHGIDQYTQIFDALEALMKSRAKQSSYMGLTWCRDEHADKIGTIVDISARYDVLDTLSFRYQTLDARGAMRMEHFLKLTKNLKKLELPAVDHYCQYGEEGYNMLLDGIQENQSLRDLTITTKSPETVLAALQGNRTIQDLTLCRSGEIPEGGHDFLKLRHLQTLCFLTLMRFHDGTINFQSLLAGLKENTSLEYIHDLDDEQIEVCLNLNCWYNRYSAGLLRSPESFSRALWPHIFARVSSNVNALNCLVRGYTALVDNNRHSRKRRRGEA